MERRSAEAPEPLDVRQLRAVQLAHAADQHARAQRLGGTVLRAHVYPPFAARLVELGRLHLGIEADLRLHAVLTRGAREIALQLGLAREELLPVGVGLEGIAVEVVAHVHAAARVGVLVPGAAHAGVLLDDHVRNAFLLQADAREDPGHAGADDQHRQRLALRGRYMRQRDLARVAPVELHLLEHHRHVSRGHLAGNQEAHHALQRCGIRGRRQRAATVAVGPDHLQRAASHLGLLPGWHRALHVVQERQHRADVAVEQARVTRHVDHRHHQAGDARLRERRRDGRVVVGDRFAGRVDTVRHGGCSGGMPVRDIIRRRAISRLITIAQGSQRVRGRR
jgi:hypothetical protein